MKSENYQVNSSVNCWIVFIKPFEGKDRGKKDVVLPYQEQCICNSLFGMGWPLDIDSIPFEQEYTPELGGKYIDEYIAEHDGYCPSKKTLSLFGKMEPNDIVITRLMNGHYYLGALSTKTLFLHKNVSPYEELSWGCKVEKWYEILDSELPARIRGRFSQSHLGTVQPIANEETKKLLYAIYTLKRYGKSSVPPTIMDKENFAQNLDYKELEDLVCLYMWDLHKEEGYILLPSSCKINQPVYEFYMTKGSTDIITCQVKNQTDPPQPYEYIEDTHIRIIYIFSGKWTKDENAVEYQNWALEIGAKNIKAVLPSALYQTLQKHKDLFANDFRIIM